MGKKKNDGKGASYSGETEQTRGEGYTEELDQQQDKLIYAELELDEPTVRNGQPVIIGAENTNPYASIAYGERGEPLPDEDNIYEDAFIQPVQTNQDKGKGNRNVREDKVVSLVSEPKQNELPDTRSLWQKFKDGCKAVWEFCTGWARSESGTDQQAYKQKEKQESKQKEKQESKQKERQAKKGKSTIEYNGDSIYENADLLKAGAAKQKEKQESKQKEKQAKKGKSTIEYNDDSIYENADLLKAGAAKQKEKQESKQKDKQASKQKDKQESKKKDKQESKQKDKQESKQKDKQESKQKEKQESKQKDKQESKQKEKQVKKSSDSKDKMKGGRTKHDSPNSSKGADEGIDDVYAQVDKGAKKKRALEPVNTQVADLNVERDANSPPPLPLRNYEDDRKNNVLLNRGGPLKLDPTGHVLTIDANHKSKQTGKIGGEEMDTSFQARLEAQSKLQRNKAGGERGGSYNGLF